MLRNTEDPHQPGKGKQENWRSKKINKGEEKRKEINEKSPLYRRIFCRVISVLWSSPVYWAAYYTECIDIGRRGKKGGESHNRISPSDPAGWSITHQPASQPATRFRFLLPTFVLYIPTHHVLVFLSLLFSLAGSFVLSSGTGWKIIAETNQKHQEWGLSTEQRV